MMKELPMANLMNDNELIPETNLQAFFHGSLQHAAKKHRLDAGDATLHYLTHLLTDYALTDRVFDHTEDGKRLRPLAMLYKDAVSATSLREQRLWLRRLGDVALFIGGLFAGRLSRRFTDLEYCIAMGGNAYGYLHQTSGRQGRDLALVEVFGELASNFARFVDLLAIVTHQKQGDEQDLIRLYEKWRATGSPRLAQELQAHGITLELIGGTH
jgi:hypothetical protein